MISALARGRDYLQKVTLQRSVALNLFDEWDASLSETYVDVTKRLEPEKSSHLEPAGYLRIGHFALEQLRSMGGLIPVPPPTNQLQIGRYRFLKCSADCIKPLTDQHQSAVLIGEYLSKVAEDLHRFESGSNANPVDHPTALTFYGDLWHDTPPSYSINFGLSDQPARDAQPAGVALKPGAIDQLHESKPGSHFNTGQIPGHYSPDVNLSVLGLLIILAAKITSAEVVNWRIMEV